MLNIILYVLVVMIFWDFSLHLIELLGWAEKFIKSKSIFSYYYPHFRWKKTSTGPVERENWGKLYQRFWVTYWGLAFILLVIYLIFK